MTTIATKHNILQINILATRRALKRARVIAQSPRFAKQYSSLALVILLFTVLYWAILGARTHMDNADAIVDPYLFKDWATFHGASFPGQHTQLLKWPLFFIVRLAGFSSLSFIALTVLLVILTIAAFVLIIYRIERRPLVRGTWFMVFASVLLLIPARPYAAGLLPVNMAMLTTRNIEYVFYIASLILLARTKHVKNWSFWLATACLTLLIASDKLFLSIGLGASLLALIMYALVRRWELVVMATYWLISQVFATLGAISLLAFIDQSHLTHLTNTVDAGPYGLITNPHVLSIGGVYALLELLTNVGANPVFNVMVLKDIPHIVLTRIFDISSLAFVVNLLIAAGCGYAMFRIIRLSLRREHIGTVGTAIAIKLSLMLVWTSIVAIGVFLASGHDYAVDTRYLSIILPTALIAGVTFNRSRRWRTSHLVAAGAVLLISVTVGLIAATDMNNAEQTALTVIEQRDLKITAAIRLHPNDILVGDYWRVVPIAQKDNGTLRVMPLATCTIPRADLSSSAWQPDLNRLSFTYLLSYDQNLTNYPSCSLDQVTQAYGRPNASVLIAGTTDHPKEQLLFYDRGAHKSAPLSSSLAKGPATVVPITLDELPNTSCSAPSIMTVVAHQDDDLLFMNPDILHALKSGYCIRTVYVTAGDGGFGDYYWLKRQRGAEAAYAAMLGTDELWVERIVKLADHEFVTVASIRGNSRVSLIFLHLPDGNLWGQGFKYSHSESLAKLLDHRISIVHGVDEQSTYTTDQLVAALDALMVTYSPVEIYTQGGYTSQRYPDHSDHVSVGRITQIAYAQYEKATLNNVVTIPIRFYVGYPVHGMKANLSGDDVQSKVSVFLNYAQYDGSVCHTSESCQRTPTYGAYLTREYSSSP